MAQELVLSTSMAYAISTFMHIFLIHLLGRTRTELLIVPCPGAESNWVTSWLPCTCNVTLDRR